MIGFENTLVKYNKDLADNNKTEIYFDKRSMTDDNVPSEFYVFKKGRGPNARRTKLLGKVVFQDSFKQNRNANDSGVTDIDALNMVLCKLENLQAQKDTRCRHKANAITHIEEAIMWLNRSKVYNRQRGQAVKADEQAE